MYTHQAIRLGVQAADIQQLCLRDWLVECHGEMPFTNNMALIWLIKECTDASGQPSMCVFEQWSENGSIVWLLLETPYIARRMQPLVGKF